MLPTTPDERRHRALRQGPSRAAALLAAAIAGCSSSRSAPPGPSAPERAGPRGPQVVGEADVRWSPAEGDVLVDATFAGDGRGRFLIDRSAVPYLHDLEASALAPGQAPRWRAVARGDRALVIDACAAACRVRYRVALRQAAEAIDDLDWAGMHGDLVEAPPSTWLLSPSPPAAADDVVRLLRFRVSAPPGAGFATGVFRAADSTAEAPVWEIDLRDLWTSPYSAFGALTSRSVDVPGGALQLAISDGATEVPRDEIVQWVARRARAVAGYWGRFPMPGALVLLAVTPGARIGGGKTLAGGGGTVVLRVGARASEAHFQRDWVLVHELVHLGFPSVPRAHLWAQEGVATYVEPIARVRAGLLDERAAWRELREGLPKGLPGAGDRGLDHTPTWGRIYWGGALFWFLGDLAIRERSGGRLGLEHALRGLLDAGGTNAKRWPLEKALALADRAVGGSALVDQYHAMMASPHPVELDAIFLRLGVTLARGEIVLDDAAPLASIRRAIMHGTDAPR
ncbi:MAG: hypothetical protein R3B48_20065 [Kofleriaceae bacterium]